MSSDLVLDGRPSLVLPGCRETAIWRRILKGFLLKVRLYVGQDLIVSTFGKSLEATQAQVGSIV
jgi:hypothetical protein